jgi:Flp pilus assembly protein TadG
MTMRHRERGGALVEFAVILPLALVFLIGIIQFGMLMFRYHATDYAAKWAARYASVHGADCASAGGTNCQLTAAELATVVREAVPGIEPQATISPGWSTPDPSKYTYSNSNLTCSSTSQERNCVVTNKITNPVGIAIPFVTIGTGANKNKMTFTSYAQALVTQ